MQADIEARIQPVVHTGENLRVVELVNKVRGLAAAILIKASIGAGFHIKPGFYGVEDRLELIVKDSQDILDAAYKLYPNQPVLNPPEHINYVEPNSKS